MKHRDNSAGSPRGVEGALLLGLLLVCSGAAGGEVPFEIICDGKATDISVDGPVIVGVAGGSNATWRWTRETGRVLLGRSVGKANEIDWETPDVSDDGRVVSATVTTGDTNTETLARWSEDGGWETPTTPSGTQGADGQGRESQARGLSGDGSTLVGQVRYPDNSTKAAAWDEDHGLVVLGAGDANCGANDANKDGSVLVGWSENPDSGIWQPTVWAQGKPVVLAATKAFCEAAAVNPTGEIVVGQAYDESRDQKGAALWLASDFGWVQEWLGTLPGTFAGNGQAMALDLTDDGHTIVGFNEYGPNRSAGFVWTLEDGLLEAHEYFADHGVEIPEGYRISSVTGVSADGRFITGYGEDTTFWPHQTRSFLARVREFPRMNPNKRVLPAGTGIPNPFETRGRK